MDGGHFYYDVGDNIPRAKRRCELRPIGVVVAALTLHAGLEPAAVVAMLTDALRNDLPPVNPTSLQ